MHSSSDIVGRRVDAVRKQKVPEIGFRGRKRAFSRDFFHKLSVGHADGVNHTKLLDNLFLGWDADRVGVDMRDQHRRIHWRVLVASGVWAVELDVLEWRFVVSFKATRAGFNLHLSLSLSLVGYLGRY